MSAEEVERGFARQYYSDRRRVMEEEVPGLLRELEALRRLDRIRARASQARARAAGLGVEGERLCGQCASVLAPGRRVCTSCGWSEPRAPQAEHPITDPGLLKAMEVFGLTKRAELTHEVVRQRYRTLAHEAHPDTGGSEDAMKRLNLARDVLVLNLTREEPPF